MPAGIACLFACFGGCRHVGQPISGNEESFSRAPETRSAAKRAASKTATGRQTVLLSDVQRNLFCVQEAALLLVLRHGRGGAQESWSSKTMDLVHCYVNALGSALFSNDNCLQQLDGLDAEAVMRILQEREPVLAPELMSHLTRWAKAFSSDSSGVGNCALYFDSATYGQSNLSGSGGLVRPWSHAVAQPCVLQCAASGRQEPASCQSTRRAQQSQQLQQHSRDGNDSGEMLPALLVKFALIPNAQALHHEQQGKAQPSAAAKHKLVANTGGAQSFRASNRPPFLGEDVVLTGLACLVTAVAISNGCVLYQNEASRMFWGDCVAEDISTIIIRRAESCDRRSLQLLAPAVPIMEKTSLNTDASHTVAEASGFVAAQGSSHGGAAMAGLAAGTPFGAGPANTTGTGTIDGLNSPTLHGTSFLNAALNTTTTSQRASMDRAQGAMRTPGLLQQLFAQEPFKYERMMQETCIEGRPWKGIVRMMASASPDLADPMPALQHAHLHPHAHGHAHPQPNVHAAAAMATGVTGSIPPSNMELLNNIFRSHSHNARTPMSHPGNVAGPPSPCSPMGHAPAPLWASAAAAAASLRRNQQQYHHRLLHGGGRAGSGGGAVYGGGSGLSHPQLWTLGPSISQSLHEPASGEQRSSTLLVAAAMEEAAAAAAAGRSGGSGAVSATRAMPGHDAMTPSGVPSGGGGGGMGVAGRRGSQMEPASGSGGLGLGSGVGVGVGIGSGVSSTAPMTSTSTLPPGFPSGRKASMVMFDADPFATSVWGLLSQPAVSASGAGGSGAGSSANGMGGVGGGSAGKPPYMSGPQAVEASGPLAQPQDATEQSPGSQAQLPTGGSTREYVRPPSTTLSPVASVALSRHHADLGASLQLPHPQQQPQQQQQQQASAENSRHALHIQPLQQPQQPLTPMRHQQQWQHPLLQPPQPQPQRPSTLLSGSIARHRASLRGRSLLRHSSMEQNENGDRDTHNSGGPHHRSISELFRTLALARSSEAAAAATSDPARTRSSSNATAGLGLGMLGAFMGGHGRHHSHHLRHLSRTTLIHHRQQQPQPDAEDVDDVGSVRSGGVYGSDKGSSRSYTAARSNRSFVMPTPRMPSSPAMPRVVAFASSLRHAPLPVQQQTHTSFKRTSSTTSRRDSSHLDSPTYSLTMTLGHSAAPDSAGHSPAATAVASPALAERQAAVAAAAAAGPPPPLSGSRRYGSVGGSASPPHRQSSMSSSPPPGAAAVKPPLPPASGWRGGTAARVLTSGVHGAAMRSLSQHRAAGSLGGEGASEVEAERVASESAVGAGAGADAATPGNVMQFTRGTGEGEVVAAEGSKGAMRDAAALPNGGTGDGLQEAAPEGDMEQEEEQEEEEGEVEWWHEVTATRTVDPVTGQGVLLLTQSDVTAKVLAERHIARVSESEHRLLEQIFPRHVLAYMTEEGGPWAPGGSVGGGFPCPLQHRVAGGWRPVVRDINKLATSHDEVTLLFADIQGFTPMCKILEPRVVMAFLNDLFTRFDRRLDEFGVYKVETIGDCYFVAGGLVQEDEDGMMAVREGGAHEEGAQHAERVFMFAKAMLVAASQVTLPTTGGPVRMRVGIHSGPVVSGVVGQRMPRFCLFGDTVNTTSRMESTGVAGCIHASDAAWRLLSNEAWVPTGGIEVKGRGLMQTYLWAPPSADLPPESQAALQKCMQAAAAATAPEAPTAAAASAANSPAAATSEQQQQGLSGTPALARQTWDPQPLFQQGHPKRLQQQYQQVRLSRWTDSATAAATTTMQDQQLLLQPPRQLRAPSPPPPSRVAPAASAAVSAVEPARWAGASVTAGFASQASGSPAQDGAADSCTALASLLLSESPSPSAGPAACGQHTSKMTE